MYVYKKYSKIFNECKAQASRNFSEYLYQFIYTNITMNLKLFSNMHEFFLTICPVKHLQVICVDGSFTVVISIILQL